jgi:hypothetical protein
MLTIVPGGQTGVDRAALDVAIASGLPHGGWCPAGSKAEDGPIDARYQLKETPSKKYDARTCRNVIDSDGTLILNAGELADGTLKTRLVVDSCDAGKRWYALCALSRVSGN